jgi:cell division protein ZapD
VSDLIVYEHPLNERIRTFLRLEHLFSETAYFLPQPEEWGSRAAIDGLIKINSIFTRADIKTEILKELERHLGNLGRIRRQQGVDMQALGQVLDELEQATNQIYRLNGQVGQRLRDNEFLKSIMQRSSIPGGSCAFDLPQFHYWLRQPQAERQTQLESWWRELVPVRDALTLLLSLTRSSSRPLQETATQGFFQQTLDAQRPTQLIRVGIADTLHMFAEISGGRHRFSIRFLQVATGQRPTQVQQEVPFSLACCVI